MRKNNRKWILATMALSTVVACGTREERDDDDCGKTIVVNQEQNQEQTPYLNCWPTPPCPPDQKPCPPDQKPDQKPLPKPECNVYMANSQLGDRTRRTAVMSSINNIEHCEVKNIFHAGDLGKDHDSWWTDVAPTLSRVGFYPSRGNEDYPWMGTSDFLKSKMPHLADKLSACKSYYTVETTSAWATVVLDTNDECSWEEQMKYLRKVASHGHERLDVVMHHTPYSSIKGAETQSWIDLQGFIDASPQQNSQDLQVTVFSGVAPGYSRDKVGVVNYVTAGSAGPERGGCSHSETTETCYPDTSFVVCTKDKCLAFNRFGNEIDSF